VSEQKDWARMALRLEQLAADLVADVRGVGDTLEGALELAVQMAPCDVASVSIRHGRGKLETTAASATVAERAHERQQDLGEGPCVEVVWEDDDVYVVSDLASTERWPRWGPVATELGLTSMIAVRLFTTRQTIGALDLYSYGYRDYDVDDILAARVVAARVSVALANAQKEQDLWNAIDSRHEIGQAEGILMERYGLTSEQAFGVLRRYSQEQNRKVRMIAQEVIATRSLPKGRR
jgi:transcriptional regulator with GAF, ATPase, and Fis domain